MSAPDFPDADIHAAGDALLDAARTAAKKAVQAGLPLDYAAMILAAVAARQILLHHGEGHLDTFLTFVRKNAENAALWGDDGEQAGGPAGTVVQ